MAEPPAKKAKLSVSGVNATPENPKEMQEFVKEYYGKVLATSKDLKTTACTAAGRPPKYVLDALDKVPEIIKSKFYGCGTPIPAAIDGLTVLDLGCGAGRDCYLSAALVGPTGKVIGLDMTDEQLSVAREHAEKYCKDTLKYPKNVLDFRKGFIETIPEAGIAPGSVDLVISNCVINLSPNKEAVIQGAATVLKEGGELYFSDVYADRRLPQEVVQHQELFGECIAGALYIEDFRRIARSAGFTDVRVLQQSEMQITEPSLKMVTGESRFYSITFRCFKLKTLETLCEDYGQVATYLGGIAGSEHGYDLDDHHHLTKGKPMLVCGNSASMLSETRLGKYFRIDGNRNTHFGLFPCGPADAPPSAAAGCEPGGACC